MPFFNYLKRLIFAPLPDMARLRGNDTQDLSRLFAVASEMSEADSGGTAIAPEKTYLSAKTYIISNTMQKKYTKYL